MNTSHITTETLANLAEGRIAPEVQEAAMAHISSCPICDNALSRLQHLVSMMRSDMSEDAPRDVLAMAIGIFSQRSQSTPSLLQRIVATLTFDSFKAAPAFGLRTGYSPSRQMLFSAGDNDLDLRITVENDRYLVAGQVIRESCTAGVVELSGIAGSAQASLNETCEFSLPGVPLGTYSLKLKMADLEVEIPELELKV
jgi:hypothetical protein